MITFKQKGDFKNMDRFFARMEKTDYLKMLEKYGAEGVTALKNATPVATSETANAWSYHIVKSKRGITITWNNSHVVDGVPIAVILQYGHATRNGGYVQGRDYINPAIKPIFDKIAAEAWKEVTKQ